MLAAFDHSFVESVPLRQYLWAHRPESNDIARKLLTILPPEHVARILRCLAGDYWRHYLGWPDLIAYRMDEYCFLEVKGSGDKLSENQKTWIDANRRELLLPFKIVKVHRRRTVEVST
ncbi:VRR-NUC domain-containing protein [Pendulispora brunnea]|uniref:VRR-NUC domain-containing protein n=1 Tax=Pendulispora brunnea TaxID=2905690 RepID=UPI00374DFFB7